MKKIITCITMLSMLLASVPASALEAAAAPAVMTAAAEQEKAPAELVGRWYHQTGDKKNGYVMVETDGTYSYFDYAQNTAYGGTVKTEYDTHPDGSRTVLYSFYDNSGKFLFGCVKSAAKTDTITLGQDGAEKLVRDTKNYETASVKDITGRFIYQTLQSGDTYKQTGYVMVNEDGTYSYDDSTTNMVTGGTVKIEYEVYPDGSTNAWYCFLDNDGKNRFSCAASENGNEFTIGNGGMAKLVKDTKNYETASIKDITGRFTYQTLQSGDTYKQTGYVIVNEDGTFSYNDDTANKVTGGTVKIGYEVYPNGSTNAWYAFIDGDGKDLFSCLETNDSNVFMIGNGGMAKLVRDTKNYETASIRDIAGRLDYQKLSETTGQFETVSTVTVSENGTYTLKDAAGKTAEGTVTLSYNVNPDGSTVAWFSFLDKSGTAWFGCYDPKDSDVLTNGGSQERMIRADITGDLTGDGAVSIDDAQLALKAYTEKLSGKPHGLTAAQYKAADVNHDGDLSVEDVQYILIYYTERSVAGKNITWDDLLKK